MLSLPAPTSPLPAPAPAPSAAEEVLDAFLRGRSPGTLRAYGYDLMHFARAVGAPSPGAAVAALLALPHGRANATALRYAATMKEADLAPATIARRLAALRSLVALARRLGHLAWSLDVEAPRVEARHDRRGPDAEGWAKLWKAARAAGDGPPARRDRAILSLLFDLALRRAEVASLDLGHLDLARGEVRVKGKGRSERERLTLPGPTRKALAEWLEARGDEPGPLFSRLDRGAGVLERLSGDGIAGLVKKLGAAAGLDRPVRPHGLRHSAITAALDAGCDVRAVRKFSRHSSIETVMIYDDRRKDEGGEVAKKVAGRRK